MTEEEARLKWCPFARVFTGTSGWVAAANRNLLDRDKGKANCQTTSCMAWIGMPFTNEGHCGLVKE